MRCLPPTTSASLESACRLSRVCALAAICLARPAACLAVFFFALPFWALSAVLMAAMQLVLGEVGVPDVHGVHRRELGHGAAVGAHRGERRVPRVGLAEAVVARRDGEARGHARDVVLERAGQRLVEVVEVEEQGALGRGEDAEVGEVRVAAELRREAGPGRVLEVGGHDPRRPAVEGERRDQHAPVAHGHQVGLASGVLFFQQRDRIGAVRRRLPAWRGWTAASACAAPCPAPGVL